VDALQPGASGSGSSAAGPDSAGPDSAADAATGSTVGHPRHPLSVAPKGGARAGRPGGVATRAAVGVLLTPSAPAHGAGAGRALGSSATPAAAGRGGARLAARGDRTGRDTARLATRAERAPRGTAASAPHPDSGG
jgi:hypothetical protein